MTTLTLQLGSISTTLSNFINDEYPRIEVNENAPTITNSIAGVSVVDGRVYEPKYLWSISCLCNQQQWEALEAIYLESDRLRRILSSFEITLIDKTAEFIELAPRTRAIAPSTSETLLYSGTYTKYYPQFHTMFIERPKRNKSGSLLTVSCQLQEVIKVLA